MRILKKSKSMLALVTAVCLILLAGTQPATGHFDSAYWHETYINLNNSRWMSRIANGTKLNQLSIPGTHDSMAYSSSMAFGEISRTQTLSLENQLKAGVRFLDIRLKHNGSHFSIHHGSIYTGFSFDDVLVKVRTFLQANPTETVLMRVKQEDSSKSDAEMKNLFNQYLNRYPNLFSNVNSSNATLGEVRGKVVIVSDVASIAGVSYRGIDKQDDYHLSTNWDLYSKWEKIKNQLYRANNGKYDDKMYLNYLSGSGGVFPYFVASGHSSSGTWDPRLLTGLSEPFFRGWYPDFPRTGWFLWFASIAFEGTNTLTANYIDNNRLRYTGIVAADFPGERLINAIINCNFR